MNRNHLKAWAVLAAIPLALSLAPGLGWSAPRAVDDWHGLQLAQADPGLQMGKPGQPGPDGKPRGPHGKKGPHGPPGAQQGNMSTALMQELGVSPEQAEKMRGIRQQAQARSKALQQQLREKQRILMGYMKSPDAQEAQARRMFGEVNDLQRRMGELRIQTWFQMRGAMTPEQLQKLEQMRQARQQRMQQRKSAQQKGPAGGGPQTRGAEQAGHRMPPANQRHLETLPYSGAE